MEQEQDKPSGKSALLLMLEPSLWMDIHPSTPLLGHLASWLQITRCCYCLHLAHKDVPKGHPNTLLKSPDTLCQQLSHDVRGCNLIPIGYKHNELFFAGVLYTYDQMEIGL